MTDRLASSVGSQCDHARDIEARTAHTAMRASAKFESSLRRPLHAAKATGPSNTVPSNPAGIGKRPNSSFGDISAVLSADQIGGDHDDVAWASESADGGVNGAADSHSISSSGRSSKGRTADSQEFVDGGLPLAPPLPPPPPPRHLDCAVPAVPPHQPPPLPRLPDLCPADKARVARLISQLAQVSEAHEAGCREWAEERAALVARVGKLRAQNEGLAGEVAAVRSKFGKSLALVAQYQEKLVALQRAGDAASAEASAAWSVATGAEDRVAAATARAEASEAALAAAREELAALKAAATARAAVRAPPAAVPPSLDRSTDRSSAVRSDADRADTTAGAKAQDPRHSPASTPTSDFVSTPASTPASDPVRESLVAIGQRLAHAARTADGHARPAAPGGASSGSSPRRVTIAADAAAERSDGGKQEEEEKDEEGADSLLGWLEIRDTRTAWLGGGGGGNGSGNGGHDDDEDFGPSGLASASPVRRQQPAAASQPARSPALFSAPASPPRLVRPSAALEGAPSTSPPASALALSAAAQSAAGVPGAGWGGGSSRGSYEFGDLPSFGRGTYEDALFDLVDDLERSTE